MIKLKNELSHLEIVLQEYSELQKQSILSRTISLSDQEISNMIYQISVRINQVNREINRLTNQKELSEETKLDETQTEISDEEIEEAAKEYVLYNDQKRAWVIEGMKLYREQLKNKICNNQQQNG